MFNIKTENIMRHYKLYLASLLMATIGFNACDDNFDYPPVVLPEADIEANTTIADLKAKYWDQAKSAATLVGENAEGDRTIIAGRVISSDETGNIYKNLVIADKTAAITIAINEYDLFESYKLGQEVVMDVTDAYVGMYSGLLQIGSDNGSSTTFLSIESFQSMAQINGLPKMSEVDTLVTTIDVLKNAINSAEGLQQWQSQLIRLDSVYFAEGGRAPYSEASKSTGRYIYDEAGNSIMVYNNSYADFQAEILPAGKGSIVGILSFYERSGWQILLRDTNDCIGFAGASDSPAGPTEALTELKADFENVSSISQLAGWSSVVVSGGKDWYFTEFSGNFYAACTAYKGTDVDGGYDSWLITPALNVDEMTAKNLSFETQAAYSGASELEVYAMTSNDPATATLTKLNCTIATPPASGYSGFVSSGNVDLSGFAGEIYIGFRYTAETSASSKTYCVDNVIVGVANSAGSTITPEEPENPTGTFNYKKVTTITSGKSYIIVAEGKAATALTSNYGYLKVVDATETDGVVTLSDNSCEFTFTSVAGGYNMVDANGKYYYQTGTYNSFNVANDASNEGSVWGIEPQSDGTMKVTNTSVNKIIQYDKQYNSYGSYSDVRGVFPTFYERVD